MQDARPGRVIEGDTFTFGKGRSGDVSQLKAWSAESGVDLEVIESEKAPLLDMLLAPVSSSLIRWLLANGRVRDAAICLGRPYPLTGLVVRGFERGRTLGFPTANLVCPGAMIPDDGVYAARCEVDGRKYPVALSIGSTPTFDARQHQIEAHLIGFDGDLYGKELKLDLLDWIREQRKFPKVDLLKQQLNADLLKTLKMFALDPARAIATC
jgi:riboflavin kinase / FMN adenylyltransferase